MAPPFNCYLSSSNHFARQTPVCLNISGTFSHFYETIRKRKIHVVFTLEKERGDVHSFPVNRFVYWHWKIDNESTDRKILFGMSYWL